MQYSKVTTVTVSALFLKNSLISFRFVMVITSTHIPIIPKGDHSSGVQRL